MTSMIGVCFYLDNRPGVLHAYVVRQPLQGVRSELWKQTPLAGGGPDSVDYGRRVAGPRRRWLTRATNGLCRNLCG
jgi:hypothetical protein